jgi:hypothetical protein
VIVSLLNAAFALTPQPDALQFQFAMSSHVLSENFEITPYSYQIDDVAFYNAISTQTQSLTSFVAQRIHDICMSQNRPPKSCNRASQKLFHTPFVRFSDAAATDQLSNWIYSIDGDNWYQFQPMREVVENYLNTPQHELVFFPNFNPEGVLVNDLSTEGQAVVFNHTTRSVTIWTINLRD